jgi:hypothetical protein
MIYNQELQLEERAKNPAPEIQDLLLDGFVDERGAACVATFENGFAAGWFFAISEACKDALDIKQTERAFKGVKETLWTQGKLYAFNHGDVFYDTREAYGPDEWQSVLNKIRVCVQIREARPSTLVESKQYRTAKAVEVIEDKSETPKSQLQQISYSRTRVNFGFVRFVVMTPNALEGKLVEEATYETDQELFVRFLQTGLLRCNDGTKHDFREKTNPPETSRGSLPTDPVSIGL